MLEQLTLAFKVIGDGLDSLKKIDAQIDALKNSMNNAKNSISSVFSGLKSKINSVKQSIINFKNKISSTFSALKAKIVANFPAISKLRNGFIGLRRGLGNFGNYAQQQFQNSKEKANSFLGVLKRIATTLAAGFTLKTAIEGAGNIEQYRNTLETVLKDSDMARKKLAWASRFANKTPFETEEVVGGMTKLQSYGIEGDRILKTTNRTYLEMIGDMASGMGKSFDQAIEAVADARTGELERLKEFGITKNMIAEFGKSKGLEIFNSKGQINDLELFNKTLFEMMDSRFGGAMEKQAKTFKGGLSTISGAAKSALSTLAGINEFGDIVENSPFQILRDKVIIPFANTLVKLQEDGTFTRWAENISNVFGEIINVGGKVIDFIVKWKEVLIPLASAFTGMLVIHEVVKGIGALKNAMSFTMNPYMLAIGAAITIGVLLYRNWDLIKAKLAALWESIKAFGAKIKDFFVKIWEKIKAFGKALWDIGKKMFMLFTPFGLIIRVGKLIIENWDLIKAKFISVFISISSFLKGTWGGIKEKFSELGVYFYSKLQTMGNFFVDLKDKVVGIFNKLINKLKSIWEKIKSTFSSVFNYISNFLKDTWEGIKTKFSELGTYFYSKLQTIGNFFIGLKDKAVDIFFKLIDKLKEVWETMKSTAASAFDFILDYVAKIWENIKGFFSNLGQKIKSLPGISWFFDDSGEKKTTTERVYFEDTPVIDGTHKIGLDYVPFDGYIAELHKGERVLTAEENNAYSNVENNSFSDIKSSTNTKNSNKTDKRVILNLTINMPTTTKAETDWNRVGEIIVEKLEDFMLQNEIAKGDI
nr:MAG TPA: tail tape measure [Caudoviricetes sp.]